MSDEKLEELGISALGDRVAITQFGTSVDREEKVEKLRSIIQERRRSKQSGNKGKMSRANTVGTKGPATQLKFEIGWKHWNESLQKYVQKKTDQGGGKREVSLARNANASDCLSMAKSFFFPGGISPEGNDKDMMLTLGNYQGQPIQQLVDKSGTTVLFTAER